MSFLNISPKSIDSYYHRCEHGVIKTATLLTSLRLTLAVSHLRQMDGKMNQLCHFVKQPENRLHGMPLLQMPVSAVLDVALSSVAAGRRV